ncbi:hypothetical protein BGZ68_007867 [Mortierella alpina]|nr:hypothetical protein BGZ68_007867 [Mortierella alpina]
MEDSYVQAGTSSPPPLAPPGSEDASKATSDASIFHLANIDMLSNDPDRTEGDAFLNHTIRASDVEESEEGTSAVSNHQDKTANDSSSGNPFALPLFKVERFIVFVLDGHPNDVEKLFVERPYSIVKFRFVYGYKTVEECDLFAKSSYKYQEYYVVFDNKWINGDVYPQVKCMFTGMAFRAPVSYVSPSILGMASGVKSVAFFVDVHTTAVSEGEMPPL